MTQKQWECWRKTPLISKDEETEEKNIQVGNKILIGIVIGQTERLKAFWRNNTLKNTFV